MKQIMQSNPEEATSTKSQSNLSTVTIQFTDGTTQSFEFAAPEIDPLTSASRLEKLLVRKQLQIHMSDRVLVIPMASIKCMEFTPVPRFPPNLSEFVIRNARPISASQAINWNELATDPELDPPTRIYDIARVRERPIASIEK
jgi:hypothetical protein